MLTKKRKFSVINLSIPTDLIRMLMKHIIRTKKVTFEVKPVLDLELETSLPCSDI
ncbi:MAG: hypothetical protein LBU14_01235 [Candidatus Peribacteria bacterium]|jgi:antitoxin component of RelBE/YafQ-DinJ toxin-antitoxin module|nr:hypothetical protein [Candidatus Peribacteria bacterium]